MSRSKLWRDRRGTAAVELALIAPVFAFACVVGTDVALLIRNRFRIEQAAVQGTQIVTQYTSLYDDDFTNTFYPVIQTIAGSTSTLNNPTAVACAVTISGLDYPVSGIRAGLLSIVWQKSYGTGACAANRIGTFNPVTAVPVAPVLNNYVPPLGVPFVVVEVASQYSLFGMSATALGALQSQYSSAMAIPRQRALPPITQGNRP